MGWRDMFRQSSPEGRRGSLTISEHNRLVNGAGPSAPVETPLWRRLLLGESRAIRVWDVWGQEDRGAKTISGTHVSERSAFKFQVVYSAISLIADGVSSLPPQAFTEAEDGTMEPAAVPAWIRKPHPEIRRFDIWNQLLVSVLAWGNGYASFMRRPSDGVIIGMQVEDPADVSVEWDERRPGYRKYRIRNGPWVTSAEVFHIQGPTLPGEPKGMSVIAQAREAIGLGLTLEEFGARYFAQGSQAKIVLELPTKDVMDETKAKQIVATFERFHRGKGNWHRPALATGGAKIHNISIPPEDAQFLQSREFQATTIAGWFRVPPHRVGLVSKSTSWGSGLAEENMAMLQHTFRPWILRLEGALTAYAPGGEDRGLFIKLGDDVLQRGTFKEAADTWGGLVELGIATPDEARIKLGLKPMGGEAAKLRDPAASGGGPADPRSKEDDRKRKQDEAAGRSRRGKSVLETHYDATERHLPGKHDQSTHGHGKGMVHTGATYDDLSPAGKKAVDNHMADMGVTREGMMAEIESKLTPENIEGGRAWYKEAREFNEDLAQRSGLSVEQVTAITAATSPLNPWPQNMKVAEKIAMKYRDYDGVVPTHRDKRTGKLDTPGQAAGRKMGGYLSEPMGVGFDIARAKPDEAQSIIDKQLTGTKRRSFYNNMLDPANSQDVTIDTWMNRVAMNSTSRPKNHVVREFDLKTRTFKERPVGISLDEAKKALGRSEKSTNGAGAGYVAIGDAVRGVAKKTGLHPHEVQAAYWIAVSGSPLGAGV